MLTCPWRGLLIAACFAANLLCLAQQPVPPTGSRGLDPVATDNDHASQGHRYVVSIGIDHYQNWPVLSTAVSDATGFAELLHEHLGFEYGAEPLVDSAATLHNINSLIDDELRARLQPKDDLVIFFAGHGTTRSDAVGGRTLEVGFLVPVDARGPSAAQHWSDYLDIAELLHKISTLPPMHILVILDSCHSGVALGENFTASRSDTRFERDMLRKPSRMVIASAQEDQLAADSGPVEDHSLFTGLMMQGLITGKADAFQQGFITATQLGAYTQEQVGMARGTQQTPRFGRFDLDEGGELIFPLGSGADQTQSSASESLTELEKRQIARIRSGESHYWDDDDPLKNFPAARSGTLKMCDAGVAWACGEAAESFRTGGGGSEDYQRAVELARKGCDGKDTESCVILGILKQKGITIAPDLAAAKELFEGSCSQNNFHACVDLGDLYDDGRGVKKDTAQSITLFRKACDGGEPYGCLNLGYSYANGDGVPKDDDQAVHFYQRACDAGDMDGCLDVGYRYEFGNSLQTNYALAVTYYQKACEGAELEGCNNLAVMYDYGWGVAKDGKRAADLLRRACDGGLSFACMNLGEKYEYGEDVPVDPALAKSLYTKACGQTPHLACDMAKDHKKTGYMLASISLGGAQ
jgi:TPR repeat protein